MKKRTYEKDYPIILNLVIFFVIIAAFSVFRINAYITEEKTNILEESFLLNDSKDMLDEVDYKKYNIQLLDAIKDKYNVNIYYGETTKPYLNQVEAKKIIVEEEVFNMIRSIVNALTVYPDDYIKEMKDSGYDFNIFLVDYFYNGTVALANRNANNEFKIYLSDALDIERAFHHEMFHVLEYYIKLEKNQTMLSANWKILNPKDFKYEENIDRLDSKYVYNYDLINDSYFLTIYSKYSDKEDRAEVFAENMIQKNRPIYLNSENALSNKTKEIINLLTENFDSFEINNFSNLI